jgi:hypothetical protein
LLGNLEPSSRLTCVAFASKNSGTVPSKPCLKGESPANVLEKWVTTNVKHRQKMIKIDLNANGKTMDNI